MNQSLVSPDFLFQLTLKEHSLLISQVAISSSHGDRRKRPYAFTENGAIMAAKFLNSPEAVRMSVFGVRVCEGAGVGSAGRRGQALRRP
jgi:hypothetical protein